MPFDVVLFFPGSALLCGVGSALGLFPFPQASQGDSSSLLEEISNFLLDSFFSGAAARLADICGPSQISVAPQLSSS